MAHSRNFTRLIARLENPKVGDVADEDDCEALRWMTWRLYGGRRPVEGMWGGLSPYAKERSTRVFPCRQCGYDNTITEGREPLINDPCTAMVTCKCGNPVGSARLGNNAGWASPGTQVETVDDD